MADLHENDPDLIFRVTKYINLILEDRPNSASWDRRGTAQTLLGLVRQLSAEIETKDRDFFLLDQDFHWSLYYLNKNILWFEGVPVEDYRPFLERILEVTMQRAGAEIQTVELYVSQDSFQKEPIKIEAGDPFRVWTGPYPDQLKTSFQARIFCFVAKKYPCLLISFCTGKVFAITDEYSLQHWNPEVEVYMADSAAGVTN